MLASKEKPMSEMEKLQRVFKGTRQKGKEEL